MQQQHAHNNMHPTATCNNMHPTIICNNKKRAATTCNNTQQQHAAITCNNNMQEQKTRNNIRCTAATSGNGKSSHISVKNAISKKSAPPPMTETSLLFRNLKSLE